MKSSSLCAGLVVLLLSLPHSAEALRCKQWTRLGPAQKEATIQRMIDGLARNNDVRQTGIDVREVRRCMEGKSWRMLEDFDDACDRGMSESLDVLDRIFKKYAWTCIPRHHR